MLEFGEMCQEIMCPAGQRRDSTGLIPPPHRNVPEHQVLSPTRLFHLVEARNFLFVVCQARFTQDGDNSDCVDDHIARIEYSGERVRV